ncbi:MAG: PH domain-containing protein [Mangrovibacterium sp.]
MPKTPTNGFSGWNTLTGIISRRALAKCEGFQIKQSFWGRMFNFGTITVTTGRATNSYPFYRRSAPFQTRDKQSDRIKYHSGQMKITLLSCYR